MTARLRQGGDIVSLLPFLVSLFAPSLLLFTMNIPVRIEVMLMPFRGVFGLLFLTLGFQALDFLEAG
jgi:hypothetical protein